MLFKGVDLDITLDDFGEDMYSIADFCGIDVALYLLEVTPGIQLYISRRESSDMSYLKRKIESSVLDSLLTHFCGRFIYIPKTPPIRIAKKYIENKSNGSNMNDIAVALNVSKATAYRIAAFQMKEVVDDGLSLFD